MKAVIKAAVILSVGLATSAFAGSEVFNTQVYANGAHNWAVGQDSVAHQNIGFVTGNGKVLNSYISAKGARNEAYTGGKAFQSVGNAHGNGKLNGVTVIADQAYNYAGGKNATAVQRIGQAD